MPTRHRIVRTKILEERGHQVTKGNRKLVCNLCNSTWSDQGPEGRYKEAQICSGIPPIGLDLQIGHGNGPRRYRATGLHINGVRVHESHRLAYHRGILFCSQCGCCTVKIVRGLKGICRMKSSCTQQKRGLNCLMLGKPPNGLVWPTESTAVPPAISPYLV